MEIQQNKATKATRGGHGRVGGEVCWNTEFVMKIGNENGVPLSVIV